MDSDRSCTRVGVQEYEEIRGGVHEYLEVIVQVAFKNLNV
jgi:hypothetical protein